MNSKYMIALIACFNLMLTACGSSSSDNSPQPVLQQPGDNGGQFGGDNDPFNNGNAGNQNGNFCARNPQDARCQTAINNAQQAGYQPYQQESYGNGYDNNGGYGSDNGYCGCPSGYQPTMVQLDRHQPQTMMCRSQVARQQTSETIYFRAQIRANGRNTHSAGYEYVQTNDSDAQYVTPTGNNCYQAAATGCDPYSSYNTCPAVTDEYGYSQPTYCQAVTGAYGQQYGECVRR